MSTQSPINSICGLLHHSLVSCTGPLELIKIIHGTLIISDSIRKDNFVYLSFYSIGNYSHKNRIVSVD